MAYALTMLSHTRRSGLIAVRRFATNNNVVPFFYQELFDVGPDTTTKYRKLTSDYVSTVTSSMTDKDGKVLLI